MGFAPITTVKPGCEQLPCGLSTWVSAPKDFHHRDFGYMGQLHECKEAEQAAVKQGELYRMAALLESSYM